MVGTDQHKAANMGASGVRMPENVEVSQLTRHYDTKI